MILSNMHILQFYQKPSQLLSLRRSTEDPTQNEIVQPCAMFIKEMAEARLGRDKHKVYKKFATEESKLLPSPEDVAKFYTETMDREIEVLSEMCVVATYDVGALATDFDAAVAALVPGMMWSNAAPDGTQILAPPTPFALPFKERVWKYGDMSGAKKYGTLVPNPKEEDVPFKTLSEQSLKSTMIKGFFKQVPVKFGKGVVKVIGEGTGTFQIQGDSGSALCDSNNRLIGLMSTGGVGNSGYAIPIEAVFGRLDVRFPDTASGVA